MSFVSFFDFSQIELNCSIEVPSTLWHGSLRVFPGSDVFESTCVLTGRRMVGEMMGGWMVGGMIGGWMVRRMIEVGDVFIRMNVEKKEFHERNIPCIAVCGFGHVCFKNNLSMLLLLLC